MPGPHLISNSKSSTKVVKKILLDEDTISIAFKQKQFEKPEELYIIAVGTPSSDVYLFDLRACPDILHAGGLWRLFKSPALLKITHDCRALSRALSKLGVELNNVFDTQAAYSLLLMERSLPARLIDIGSLYDKFADEENKFSPLLQFSIENGGIFWAQRPISNEMVYAVCSEALALLHTLYPSLKCEISNDMMDIFGDLCISYTTGKYRPPSDNVLELEAAVKTPRLAHSFKSDDKYLLQNSLSGAGLY